MSLTDLAVRNAKPREKNYRLFDERGLYLEVSKAGGRWWRLKYRFQGREKRLALGVYPDVTLKDARDRRDEARRLLSNGIDPSEHRKITRAEAHPESDQFFQAVAYEWYAKFSPNWATGHSKRVLSLMERDILPWIGNDPINEIPAPKLLEIARRVESRGALETAHRSMRLCSQVFRYGVATGKCDRDPTGDLRGALPPIKGGHFAATLEPQRLGEIIRDLRNYHGTFVVRCALQLAPLLFVRPGELRQARWVDIDLDAAEWRYLVSKTETQHVVPLAQQAVDILNELKPLTSRGPYVFPSIRSPRGERPMSDNAVLSAMRTLGIRKDEMSGHGFRAVARTILDEELGFRPDIIEHQLAHAVRDPLGRAYNRTTHLEERRRMMQTWADHLDTLVAKVSPEAVAQPLEL